MSRTDDASVRIYLVGGAVRDDLLGIPVHERDWVVVGATPEQMVARGYAPCDRDFPVFRDPRSGDEYALARRETKQGEGYRGFQVYAGPDVTLLEDLRRRDLTVNAMAQADDGSLIDPFDGRADLDAGLLRHVSPAFEEDPVRVLRLARFAAKLGAFGFRVAHPTHRLVKLMVERGDMAYLTAERVWREMCKAMHTSQPWRFFEVLHACGASKRLLPALADALGPVVPHRDQGLPAPLAALRHAAAHTADGRVRIAATFAGCASDGRSADALVAALRADRETAQLLRRAAVAGDAIERAVGGDADALLDLIRLWRGLDDRTAFDAVLTVADAQQPQSGLREMLSLALDAVQTVSVADLRAGGASGSALGAQLLAARREAVVGALRAADLIT
ncbi:MAG: rhodanese [Gammaproteobacteria bacterium]|nr:rhodanese [Gammaproteobacteria bacterium]